MATSQISVMWKGLTKKQKKAYEVRAVQDQGEEEEEDVVLGPRGAVQPQAKRPRGGEPANPPLAGLPLADHPLADPLLANPQLAGGAGGEGHEAVVDGGREDAVERVGGQDQEDVVEQEDEVNGGQDEEDVIEREDVVNGADGDDVFDGAGGEDVQQGGGRGQHQGAVPKTRGKRLQVFQLF